MVPGETTLGNVQVRNEMGIPGMVHGKMVTARTVYLLMQGKV